MERAKVKWPGLGDASARLPSSRGRASHRSSTTSGSSRRAARSALREALGVGVQLALIDEALLVLVEVLDRVLDREDVLAALAVDLVDHGRERRGLAAAGGPGDEHEAARPIGQLGDHRRQPQVLEAAGSCRESAGRPPPPRPLLEDVAAEAREPLDAEREVELQFLFEALLLRVGEHAIGELLRLHGGEGRQVRRRSLPSTRTCGGDLVVRWRSVPAISVIVFSNWCRLCHQSTCAPRAG